MDLPAEVQIHNEILGIKGTRGTLVMVSPHGFYDVKLKFGDNLHKVLLPIPNTVLVFRDPEAQFEGLEIER